MTDKRPCPYCWTPPEPVDPDADYLPEGGFAPVHLKCQAAVDAYIKQSNGL